MVQSTPLTTRTVRPLPSASPCLAFRRAKHGLGGLRRRSGANQWPSRAETRPNMSGCSLDSTEPHMAPKKCPPHASYFSARAIPFWGAPATFRRKSMAQPSGNPTKQEWLFVGFHPAGGPRFALGGWKTWAKSGVERPPGLSAWGMRQRGAEVFVAEAHGVRARFLRAAIFFLISGAPPR